MATKRMRKVYAITCDTGSGDALVVTLRFIAFPGETIMGFRNRHIAIANRIYDTLSANYGAVRTEFIRK